MISSDKKLRQAVLIGVEAYKCSLPAPNPAKWLTELKTRLVNGRMAWTCQLVGGSGQVSQNDMNDAIKNAIKEAMGKDVELLVYFTGHAFRIGEDLWLASSEHDPYAIQEGARGISLQGLFQRAETAGIKHLVIILDCHDDSFITEMVLPRNTTLNYAIIASGSDYQHRGSLTTALIDGLGSKKIKKAPARDGLERVTPLSLAMYLNDIQKSQPEAMKPVYRACMSEMITIRDATSLERQPDLKWFKQLFGPINAGCSEVVNVDGDYEIEQKYSVKDPRSRPDGFPSYTGKVGGSWTEKMVKMEVFKHLRNLGYLETCSRIKDKQQAFSDEDSDLYWACVHNQAVRLTPLGVSAWRHQFG